MSKHSRGHDVGDLKACVAEVLGLAQRLGASQAEASASFDTGLSVSVRMQSVETLEYQRDQGVGVTVYLGKRKGSASTTDLQPAAIEESVRKAMSLARHATEDDCAGLADPDRLARDIPDLDLWHPWSMDAAAAIDLATRCEAAALEHDPRITNSEGASVGSRDGARAYGNSHGFLEGYRSSSHSLSCAVLASDGSEMERDYEFTSARDPVELMAAPAVGREAATRALARLGARKIDTRTAPVLYPARLARGLIAPLVGALSGRALYRRASFLLDSLGTQVLADHVGIDERPHLPKALASAPYDGEGVATADRQLIEAGVVRGYVLGSYSARKLGMQSTGNAGGVYNLVVSSSAGSPGFDELLAELGTGFLVTELMGSGINPVTGDYSRGASGFWVEGGRIRFPVSEVTVAGNLRDMYRDIIAVGGDVDLRGAIRSGSILVREMTIAGS